ncbi:MAG: hypothetical protein ACREL3_07595 [Gemmatimonadales bacterium]
MRVFALTVLLIAGVSFELAAQAVPYNIDRRPQPRGTVLDSLLPQVVGPFRRVSFAPRTPVPVNQILVLRYGAGADSILLAFRIPGRPEDAQASVKDARDKARGRKIDLKGADYDGGQDPSYFRTDRTMAWSRGGYYFSAEASSQGALDRFMPAFPF